MCSFYICVRTITILAILTGIALVILSYLVYSCVHDTDNSFFVKKFGRLFSPDPSKTEIRLKINSSHGNETMEVTWEKHRKTWSHFQPFLWALSGVTVTCAILIIISSSMYLCTSDSGAKRNVKKWMGVEILLTLPILIVIIVTVSLGFVDIHQENANLMERFESQTSNKDDITLKYMKDSLASEEVHFINLCIILASTSCFIFVLMMITCCSMARCKDYQYDAQASLQELLAIEKYY